MDRLRDVAELVRCLLAVPHLIRQQAVLERRVEKVEAITGELYTGANSTEATP